MQSSKDVNNLATSLQFNSERARYTLILLRCCCRSIPQYKIYTLIDSSTFDRRALPARARAPFHKSTSIAQAYQRISRTKSREEIKQCPRSSPTTGSQTTALFLDAITSVLICRSCTPGTRPEEEVQVLRGKTLTCTENQVRTSSSSSQPEALFVFRSIQTHQVPPARLSSTLQTTQFTRRGNPSCHRWITSPPGGGLRLHISTAYSTLQVKHTHTHKHLSPTVTNAMGVIFIVNYLPATDACRTAENLVPGPVRSKVSLRLA